MTRPRKEWYREEVKFLKENFETKTYDELAQILHRTRSSIMHYCARNGLTRRSEQAKIGDVINGWEIVEIYVKDVGSQNVSYAKVKSTISDKTGEYRLTHLTQGQVGWPDRRRPDVVIKNTTHGQSYSRLYSIWNGMKTRCLNKKAQSYKNYGGRGITICDEWMIFENFYYWAINNGYQDYLTLNRINNDFGYCSENCNWITVKEQQNNRSDNVIVTAWGETKTVGDWSVDVRCKVSHDTLLYRIRVGWNPEFAISLQTNGTKDGFNRYKAFYSFIKEKHPEVIEKFIQSGR